mmetsp:Transcript_2695/g.5626  ORF Transcript_2695/g.5626 Transcript_2695/m.5626 type:complete len:390 (+) Transcript_2695:14-1183(+)
MELVQPPSAAGAAPCPVVVLDSAANPVVVLTQDDESHDASASKINWTRARDIALLGQIAKKGKVAFETKRGGAKTKDGTKIPTQEQVWAGPNGIIPVLKAEYGELFKGVKWPSTQSVINHVTHKQSGLLFKYKHLYTEGMEQSEPAAAGTEGTKDETALGEFEKLIIEVAEIYNDVKVEKVNLENEKSGEKEKQDSRQERMQDEACKGDFEEMSADERAGSRAKRKAARIARLGGASGSSSSSSFAEKSNKRKVKRMTVREYMDEQYLPDTDYEKILDGSKLTPGWKLLSVEDTDALDLQERVLEKQGYTFDAMPSFRDDVGDAIRTFTETTQKKLELQIEESKNRLEERKRELDLAERDMAMREARAKSDAERDKMMLEFMAKMANKI